MITEHLGAQIDIHTGGVDNIFPHHEDERAQSEADTGLRPFARVRLDGQHLLADDLALPRCLALLWSLARGPGAAMPDDQKAALARDFDRLLGLDLGQPPGRRLPDPFRAAVSSPRAVADQSHLPPTRDLSVVVV